MRLIDANELNKVKFHPLPYTHITPSDVEVESYQRGWNDAIDAIMTEAPTIETEQRWTPVGEGLPKYRDWYFGIFKEPDTGWVNPLPYVCDYVGKITRATTYEGWILHNCTDQFMPCEYYKELLCVAWMPLPKTWEGGAE